MPCRRPASVLGAFAVGLAFGFGWTPCVGPVLTSILLLAGTEASVGRGAALLAAYAAGIGVPFVAAALVTGPFLAAVARFRASLGVIEKAMGLAAHRLGAARIPGRNAGDRRLAARLRADPRTDRVTPAQDERSATARTGAARCRL